MGVKINLINVRREVFIIYRVDFYGFFNGVFEAVFFLIIVVVGGSVFFLGGGSCGEGGIYFIIFYFEVIIVVVYIDFFYLDVWEKKVYCIFIFYKNLFFKCYNKVIFFI